MNWEAKILDNFSLGEARCHGWEGDVYHDCGLVILLPELVDPLDWVREKFGYPIKINSWNRCRLHNAAVGGKDDSYHQNGRAIDPSALFGGCLEDLEKLCRQAFPFVLPYSTFLHCDIRGERP